MMLRLTAGIMALNLVSLVVVGWAMLAPVQLAEIYNEPFPVSPKVVTQGGEISYPIHFSKHKEYQVDSHKTIVCGDGTIYQLPPNNTSSPIGEHTITIHVTIPNAVQPDVCHIQIVNTYYINALRTEHRTMNTTEFTVIERI